MLFAFCKPLIFKIVISDFKHCVTMRMNPVFNRKTKFTLPVFLILPILIFGSLLQIFAHDGEDHSEPAKKTVSAGTKTITQVVRAGHFEITLKHAALEPDTKTAAQVFVTNYETNAATENAKVNLIVERDGNTEATVEAQPTEMPGMLSLELPPMPEGAVKFNVQITAGGESEKASFGVISVARQETAETSAQTSWARTALLVFAALFILGLIGAGSWFAVRRYREIQGDEQSEAEIVSA